MEKPWMTDAEITHCKRELSLLKSPIEVLEWGAGWSTLYYSAYLKVIGSNFHWLAIEYDQAWDDRISPLLQTNVELVIFPEDNPTNDSIHEKPMDKYVLFPRGLEKKFDLIFVDGRQRRRCLLEALDLLKADGTVLLHDASRPYYHCVLDRYKGQFLEPNLWMGKMKENGA